MNRVRLLALFLLLPLALSAADRILKVDRERSYVDVDVKVTVGDFTARLEAYELTGTVDEKNRIKTAALSFRFADLKTGDRERDKAMIDWLGGGDPKGRFDLGIVALTPSGQGQVNGTLAFHDRKSLVEFPVNVVQSNGTFTITGETQIDHRHWGLKTIRRGFVIKVDPFVTVKFKFTVTAVDAPPAK